MNRKVCPGPNAKKRCIDSYFIKEENSPAAATQEWAYDVAVANDHTYVCDLDPVAAAVCASDFDAAISAIVSDDCSAAAMNDFHTTDGDLDAAIVSDDCSAAVMSYFHTTDDGNNGTVVVNDFHPIYMVNNCSAAVLSEFHTTDSENNCGAAVLSDVRPTGKFRERKPFKQKFIDKWKMQFSWLESKDEKSFCKICVKFLGNNISNLERHGNSDGHKRAELSLQKQPQINETQKLKIFQAKINTVKTAELKVIIFLCLYNLPFTLITPLIELIKNVAKDDPVVKDLKCGRTKAAETVNSVLSESCLKILSETLRKNKFSIIIDETTDISSKKCLAVVARYFDQQKGKIFDRFLSLIELNSSDSKSIFHAIKEFLAKLNIPITNVIGFAADNAATMMGSLNGVQSLLKKINPQLYVVGCICHSMSLCSSAASRALPREVEFLVRDIYLFFSFSSKRQKQYEEFQEHFDVKKHKILKSCNTRWLSLEAAVQRILEQWPALVHFFLYSDFEGNDVAASISSRLTEKNKCYLTFLAYALNSINKINLEFQSETPRFHILLRTLKMYFKNVASNFINLNMINVNSPNKIDFTNSFIFKSLENVYVGPRAEMLIQSGLLNEAEICEIKQSCKQFYLIVCKQIISRINFEDPVLTAVEILNPDALGESLLPLIRIFPNLVCDEDIIETEEEWRLLILQDLPKEKCLEDFWHFVFLLKSSLGEILYPSLKKFIGAVLSLPHSSATTERVFSQTKLIKDSVRNRLNIETVNALMLIKDNISEENFKGWLPTKELLSKYNKI